MRKQVRSLLVSMLVMATIGTSACGEPTSALQSGGNTDSYNYAVAIMRNRHENGASFTPYTRYWNVVPGIKETAQTKLHADTVLMGDVVGVEPGRGFIYPPEDGSERQPPSMIVDFDNLKSTWRTIHLIVEPREQIGRGPELDGKVRVGLAIAGNTNAQEFMDGVSALKSVVLPLTKTSVFRYDQQVWSVIDDGALLASVSRDGSLVLPFIGGESEVAELLHDTPTLTALREKADEQS